MPRRRRRSRHEADEGIGLLMAEIRPNPRERTTIEERLDELERRGVIVRSSEPRGPLTSVAKRPGALKRFLSERD